MLYIHTFMMNRLAEIHAQDCNHDIRDEEKDLCMSVSDAVYMGNTLQVM